MFIRARIVRHAVIAAAVLLTLWYYSSAIWPPSSEWARLQHRMNHGVSPGHRHHEAKSSFDWSTVNFTYPPDTSIPLPKPRGQQLPHVQYQFHAESSGDAKVRNQRLAEVRRVFDRAWKAYRKFAWKQDALLPIAGGGKEQFSGWAATLVDSLDTLWIMGLRDEFDEAVAAVAEIDFGTATGTRVNIFETNIRYLGGLMAAYDLSGREVLLKKAIELGDFIFTGFNTENGMPVDFINFNSAKEGEALIVEGSVVSASPGTLSLELAHLSQLTGNQKYYSVVSKVMDVFYEGQNRTHVPGVWPMSVSMSQKDVVAGTSFTLGGGVDSLLEYLPKMHQLLGGGEPKYEIMTKRFLQAADEHFLFRPMLPGGEDILLPGNVNYQDGKLVLDPETEHLACFVGGMWGLSGKLFNQPSDVNHGIKLTNGCVYAYRAFPSGMMPERIDLAPCKDRTRCPWDDDYWVQERRKRPEWKDHLPKGFTTAKDPRYLLRPEAIESVFYMYRITGRSEFREVAWHMFTAIVKGSETKYANAAVMDVTKEGYPLELEDYMESFWLAETLKYFYLIFSSPDVISLDEYVLNTEAHPFKLRI